MLFVDHVACVSLITNINRKKNTCEETNNARFQ